MQPDVADLQARLTRAQEQLEAQAAEAVRVATELHRLLCPVPLLILPVYEDK